MGEFVDAALSFPTVLFSFLLVVVVAYWLVAAFGVLDVDDGAQLDSFGLPLPVVATVLIVVTWFAALVGTVLTGAGLIRWAVLGSAVLIGVGATGLAAIPLRKLLSGGRRSTRTDFVGRTCVIRTGTVSQTFGQAEVTAADGSSAVVQVRQPGRDELTNGSTAVIFDYDSDGEFFWVTPLDIK
ncbi:hypothetical protein [Pseudonocardia spinosispora]|uniref:hypothetical protein n=1 Tax=Pseudonocardia spinosispora TaxID=103441 RepID=UPI00041CA62F|nr:hypothetical protein [Pseudonocardia spinosispora]